VADLDSLGIYSRPYDDGPSLTSNRAFFRVMPGRYRQAQTIAAARPSIAPARRLLLITALIDREATGGYGLGQIPAPYSLIL
jgi:hypothetical protein